ncbi:unnamed protein product [Linum tenue]|uniref:Uncharacterized protein n=1 Tax=Linum tenue TaxID=586396 RepID=A0AAV0S8E4_9ROSI|nr:unnamed protein product [Linum tenue]
MSPTLCSQGAVVATAMAVSGTFILLALRLQKSIPVAAQFSVQHQNRRPIVLHQSRSLRSCISSDGKKSEKSKKKKNKKVRFAEDVVEPRGNGDEFRRHCEAIAAAKMNASSSPKRCCGDVSPPEQGRGMPENRRALYSGILRDRGIQRLTYSC